MFRNAKRFTAILLVLILAASTYAFAAANTVVQSNAGFGASNVNGWAITAIDYDIDYTLPNTPGVIAIGFVVAPINNTLTNATPPAFVDISTSRTVLIAADPLSNPPIIGHALTAAIWSEWSCATIVAGTGANTWNITCAPTTVAVLLTEMYALDIVVSSSLDGIAFP